MVDRMLGWTDGPYAYAFCLNSSCKYAYIHLPLLPSFPTYSFFEEGWDGEKRGGKRERIRRTILLQPVQRASRPSSSNRTSEEEPEETQEQEAGGERGGGENSADAAKAITSDIAVASVGIAEAAAFIAAASQGLLGNSEVAVHPLHNISNSRNRKRDKETEIEAETVLEVVCAKKLSLS